jgi:hypothetical protein
MALAHSGDQGLPLVLLTELAEQPAHPLQVACRLGIAPASAPADRARAVPHKGTCVAQRDLDGIGLWCRSDAARLERAALPARTQDVPLFKVACAALNGVSCASHHERVYNTQNMPGNVALVLGRLSQCSALVLGLLVALLVVFPALP